MSQSLKSFEGGDGKVKKIFLSKMCKGKKKCLKERPIDDKDIRLNRIVGLIFKRKFYFTFFSHTFNLRKFWVNVSLAQSTLKIFFYYFLFSMCSISIFMQIHQDNEKRYAEQTWKETSIKRFWIQNSILKPSKRK